MGREKSNYQSIVTIDNYNGRYYRYREGELEQISKLSYKSKTYTTTFVANKDLIIAPVSVSRNIEEEDLPGALEDKAYEELGLDPAMEYLIHYQEFNGEGEGRHFQLFVLEESRYEELFENLRQELRYVDLILPAPLLYQSLYDRSLVDRRQVHCYLYFTNYDATITFYKNGEYLYSKSINYSLRQLYDRYCEIAGKTVDEKQFFRILQKEGVKTTHLEFQQNLIKLFNEIFITINDVVIYTKRAYKIDVIDQMYIGSELGPISGADEYARNYLGLHSTSMIFDFNIKSEEWYIDQMHYMMVLSTGKYWEEPGELINFTQYPRPPAFAKRPSGQFVLTMLAALLVASAYPTYYLISSYLLDLNNLRLSKEESGLGREANRYKMILGKKKKEIERLQKRVSILKKTYLEKEKTLLSVYDKKVNYHLKSNQLASFAEDLERFRVRSNGIKSDDDRYTISLSAKDDRNITGLVKYITKRYGPSIRHIEIGEIKGEQPGRMKRIDATVLRYVQSKKRKEELERYIASKIQEFSPGSENNGTQAQSESKQLVASILGAMKEGTNPAIIKKEIEEALRTEVREDVERLKIEKEISRTIDKLLRAEVLDGEVADVNWTEQKKSVLEGKVRATLETSTPKIDQEQKEDYLYSGVLKVELR